MANPGLSSLVRIATGITALIVLGSAAGMGQAIGRSDRGPRRSESVAAKAQGDGDTGIKKRITVEGNTGLNWVDTGINVSPGDLVRLAATGEVDVKSEWGSHGPEGTTKFSEQPPGYYPVESKTRYGLSARITSSKGKEQQKWSYGDAREMVVKLGGRLWLTVNDDAPDGNEGEYDVTITIILKKG